MAKVGLVCPGFCGVELLEWHVPSDEEDGRGRRGYPQEFRSRVLELIRSGRLRAWMAGHALGEHDVRFCPPRRPR
jgi:hypothetical protein